MGVRKRYTLAGIIVFMKLEGLRARGWEAIIVEMD